jgi:hypothetical protein
MRILYFAALVLLASCGVTESSTQNEVKKETRDKRKAPIIFAAKSGNYFFNLRNNDFFDFYGPGELYAGTYVRKGDSILLGFHNNHKPPELNGRAFINNASKEFLLASDDPSRHRRLTILLGN